MEHADIPPCSECTRWLYDKDWKPVKRLNQPVPRPRGSPTPCHKCPKGPAPFAKEPTPRTLATIDYYYQCQADTTGLLPRDRRVIRNNALIASIMEQIRLARSNVTPLLAFLTMFGGAERGKKR